MKRVAIYCRVSTADQDCDRQERDLRAFAARAGYDVVEAFKETASGTKNDRMVRQRVMQLAQSRKIDVILVTELTRWGRSTVDLLQTLATLNEYGVSVVAEKGDQFDLSTAQGKMIAGVLAVLAQFERDLLVERTKSGLAAARARGKKLGRQHGHNPSDRHAAKVLEFQAQGKTIRWIADELHLSTTTVQRVLKRRKQA